VGMTVAHNEIWHGNEYKNCMMTIAVDVLVWIELNTKWKKENRYDAGEMQEKRKEKHTKRQLLENQTKKKKVTRSQTRSVPLVLFFFRVRGEQRPLQKKTAVVVLSAQ
jgi:hypothetical protein